MGCNVRSDVICYVRYGVIVDTSDEKYGDM